MFPPCSIWVTTSRPPSLICIVGPKGLSPQVVETLQKAFKEAMADPDFIKMGRELDQPVIYRDRKIWPNTWCK